MVKLEGIIVYYSLYSFICGFIMALCWKLFYKNQSNLFRVFLPAVILIVSPMLLSISIAGRDISINRELFFLPSFFTFVLVSLQHRFFLKKRFMNKILIQYFLALFAFQITVFVIYFFQWSNFKPIYCIGIFLVASSLHLLTEMKLK